MEKLTYQVEINCIIKEEVYLFEKYLLQKEMNNVRRVEEKCYKKKFEKESKGRMIPKIPKSERIIKSDERKAPKQSINIKNT